MSCPTCDHAMGQISLSIRYARMWCERCGTTGLFDTVEKLWSDVSVPKLVERCRKYQHDALAKAPSVAAVLRIYGIAEAINPPKEQP